MGNSFVSKEPLSMFGALYSVCIRDDYAEEKKLLAEGVAFIILGAVSSLVTTYVLAYLGVLV